ncbi:hypothetical protein GOV13_01945 [Candidatus Pacearchaeota archaeon]|nr:hypothetical protein [Candidatus Pacearchaeota archaeon]
MKSKGLLKQIGCNVLNHIKEKAEIANNKVLEYKLSTMVSGMCRFSSGTFQARSRVTFKDKIYLELKSIITPSYSEC